MSFRLLYLASNNPGKLREFRQAAVAFAFDVQNLPGLNTVPPSPEDGLTFQDNARKKAVYYSTLTTEMVFADDSGICVDALGGAPGVFSARFAGGNASDAANNAKLLGELAGIADDRRSAHYVCAIALARKQELLAIVEGRADGVILRNPRGAGGFGYDPFFFYPPLGKTFAELSLEEKFKVSHRGLAFLKLLGLLTA